MKKIISSSVVLGLLSFSGCAYKQECGIDKCGHKYIDTTYRNYVKNNCECQHGTEILTKSLNCTPCKIKKPVVAPVSQKAAVCLPKDTPILAIHKTIKIHVVGQGVAPCNGACSPAQALALAKRAAIADAYRQIAEKVKGVYVEGDDYIKNMMVKRSTIRTSVNATVRNANIVETSFKEGLCEVEMEVKLRYSDIVH